jgi:Sap, sulfolipid-1-addressing protein
MAFQLIALALATAVRPASLAAIYALLLSSAPRRLMWAYVLVGAGFTISVGLLVILPLHGVSVRPRSNPAKGVAEIIGGVIVLGFGVLLATGKLGSSRASEAPHTPGRLTTALNKRATVPTAALAGPATHIPGIFYLVALDLIVSQQSKAPVAVLDLMLYNLVWFSLPIAALAICMFRPAAAAETISAVQLWARAHARALLTAVAFVIGTIMIVAGIVKV